MMRAVSFLFVSVLAGIAFAGCQSKAEEAASAAPAKAAQVGYDLRVIRPADEELGAEFDTLHARAVQEGKRVAVLFSADWCAPCKRIEAELGNLHPASQIGDVRIVMVKEEDWRDATRMKEFDGLRLRWSPAIGAFPLFVLLDEQGAQLEEMKKAIPRLEALGLEPTVANWFGNPATSSDVG